jgi:hypothetical protein
MGKSTQFNKKQAINAPGIFMEVKTDNRQMNMRYSI